MAGFSFGGTSQPSTGFSFGGNQNTATSFGFGTNTSNSTGFGQAPPAPFGTTTSTPGFATGFSTTPFGTHPTTASGFGFGTGTTTGGTGLFGSKPATAGTGFGTLTGGSLFNQPKATQSAFGLGTSFKGFGQPTTSSTLGTSPFGFQQPLQPTVDPSVALYMAVCAPAYFNDERDEVLKKWNQLQAVWGSGKGYYAQNMPPVDFTPENPFCRFKAVGYVKAPNFSSEEGLVEVIVAQKEADVKMHQQQIVETLVKVFDGCQVCVHYVTSAGNDKTRMCFFVQQRNPNGETKKVDSVTVYNHLTSPNQKPVVQNLCIENLTPLVSLTESQLKGYLDNPPQGLDPTIWEQGKRSNPDPKKYIPVAMVGFDELKARFKAQEQESALLQGQLDMVAEEITQLQSKMSCLMSNLQECKRRQLMMSHRVLKLVIKQEVSRKRGVPIEQGEEHLRMILEPLHSQLQSPTQYMGRLNELLSQISVQSGSLGNGRGLGEPPRFSLDIESEKNLHQFLSWEQEAIREIVNIVKRDLETVDTLLTQEKKK